MIKRGFEYGDQASHRRETGASLHLHFRHCSIAEVMIYLEVFKESRGSLQPSLATCFPRHRPAHFRGSRAGADHPLSQPQHLLSQFLPLFPGRFKTQGSLEYDLSGGEALSPFVIGV